MISSIASRGSDSAAAIVSTPTGPPPKLTAIAVEIAPVHHVEADRVDVEQLQRRVGELARRPPPRPSTTAKSRTRRSSRPAMRGVPRERRAISLAPSSASARPSTRAARADDPLEFRDGVEVEADRNAEAVAQRRRQQPRPRRGADQRERRQVDLHRARRRPRADDEVELEILHRGIEDLLDRRVEAMDLVDEQHVARLRDW